MPPLSSKLSAVTPRDTSPLWTGPDGPDPNGGVTQGLLSRYLVCPERARVHLIEGLRPHDRLEYRREFGSAWHVCEEALAASGEGVLPGRGEWEARLKEYCRSLASEHPTQAEEADKIYNVVRVTFPLYVDYWHCHPDVTGRTPLLQEQAFDVPYRLPSGRTVRLRGKWDSVDLIGGGIWLQENKTKSDIDEGQVRRQLSFDLQTMLYLVALQSYTHNHPLRDAARRVGAADSVPIVGVRYNVIRRPLSGGKGSIVRHKGKPATLLKSGKWSKAVPEETKEAYYRRAADYVRREPATYFMRWQCRVSPADVTRFRREFLDPCLENLCDDYEWWSYCGKEGMDDLKFVRGGFVYDYDYRGSRFPRHRRRHFRMPFGVYSLLLDGGGTDLDAYLDSGNAAGLEKSTVLFPELEDQ